MSHPTIALPTARGTFRVAVDGDAAAPALVLSNSLGTTLDMWEPQVPAFARGLRVIRYDTRGHGGSSRGTGPKVLDKNNANKTKPNTIYITHNNQK